MFQYAGYREVYTPEHAYVFTTIQCPEHMGGCGEQTEIEIKGPDLYKINQGAYICEAAPYISRAEAERLITGFCPKCWDKIFADPEED